jgi:hypothetical protein
MLRISGETNEFKGCKHVLASKVRPDREAGSGLVAALAHVIHNGIVLCKSHPNFLALNLLLPHIRSSPTSLFLSMKSVSQ